MKIENVKLSIGQTKNPMFFQISFHIGEDKAKEANLSHSGRAFAVVAKDELKALMGAGFKPFSLCTLDVVLREEDNIDPTKASLLKFELIGAQFKGGIGDWGEILNAPAPALAKKETTPLF